MINYSNPSLDLEISNKIFKPFLKKIAKENNFATIKNTNKNFTIQHRDYPNNQINYFQICMSRHGSSAIYPPTHISIWLSKDDFLFQLTVDVQNINLESLEYIIKKLVTDFTQNL
jgi:hypothetical protein